MCKSNKQINISTIAKTALSKGIGESQLSIHPLAYRMLDFSVLRMLKYNIDDNLVGQLTIIRPPIVELYHEQSWDKGPTSDSRSSSPL